MSSKGKANTAAFQLLSGYSFFKQLRVVNWADTDAAAIVYTGRLVEFMLEAIEAWFRDRLEINWYELNVDRHIVTPFVNVSVDFSHPVTPRQNLEIVVGIERVGTTSVTYRVHAYGASSGMLHFVGCATTVFATTIDMTSIGVPEEYRATYIKEADAMARWLADHDSGG